MRANILIVDDDSSFSSSLRILLRKNGISSQIADGPSQALSLLSKDAVAFDLLVIDYNFANSNITGANLAEVIKKKNPHQSYLFASGFDDPSFYKAMLEAGSSKAFIAKGEDSDKIISTIQSVLSEMGIKKTASKESDLNTETRRESAIRSLGLIGKSKALLDVVKQVENYRRFKSRFLIIGPSGSGKEIIAKAFKIEGKPFFAVDCTRFSLGQEHFLESELYGHKKGAYTGADQDKKGVFEVANGGVVFLDELHTLSPIAQSKLLRVLQENRFRRLGDSSGAEIPFDVTLIAAAKPEISAMLTRGEFKEDLYYRIAKSEIIIPSLKERIEDVEPLAKFFTEKYSNLHGLSRVIHPQTIRAMKEYSWPGNVRELEGVIENLVMTSSEEVISPDQFKIYIVRKTQKTTEEQDPNENINLVLSSVESHHVVDALMKSRFVTGAAELLGIPRTTLNEKIKKLKINPYDHLGKGLGR